MKEPKNLNEIEELELGEAVGWSKKLHKIFPAFKHHNYRLFFFGQLVSLTGSWLQSVAQGWLVLQLTHSVFWVSAISTISLLPVFIFSLPAGVLVDRFSKRWIVLVAESTMMVIAFLMAGLTQTHLLTIEIIAILSFISGIATAIDMPARQTFMVDVVGKKDLPSAIALNAGIFNAARVIGPAMAGILVALINIQGAFLLNALSFIAVIAALLNMQVVVQTHRHTDHPIEQMRKGLAFAFKDQLIRGLLLVIGASAVFGWGYSSIMPSIADTIFHTSSIGYGLLLSATGLGALTAAFLISAYSEKINTLLALQGANYLVAIGLLLFSLNQSFLLALPVLFLIGFSLIVQASLCNATIQKVVPDYIRGRVMSIYTFCFIGMIPFGSLAIGILADHFGIPAATRIFALVSFATALYCSIYFKDSTQKVVILLRKKRKAIGQKLLAQIS